MRGVRWKRGEGSSAGHTVSTRPNQTQNLSMIGDGATLPSGRALRSPVTPTTTRPGPTLSFAPDPVITPRRNSIPLEKVYTAGAGEFGQLEGSEREKERMAVTYDGLRSI